MLSLYGEMGLGSIEMEPFTWCGVKSLVFYARMGDMDADQMNSNQTSDKNQPGKPAGDASPTQPGKRLRRILSSELETSLDQTSLQPEDAPLPALLPDTPVNQVVDNQSPPALEPILRLDDTSPQLNRAG